MDENITTSAIESEPIMVVESVDMSGIYLHLEKLHDDLVVQNSFAVINTGFLVAFAIFAFFFMRR